jgi:hypothetical protein
MHVCRINGSRPKCKDRTETVRCRSSKAHLPEDPGVGTQRPICGGLFGPFLHRHLQATLQLFT